MNQESSSHLGRNRQFPTHKINVTPPTKPSLRTENVSELSFFWNPEVENTNGNVSPSNENKNENENDNENENKSDSEFSFFWISKGVTEDVTKCASVIAEFTSLISNPIATCKIPTAPIRNVPTVTLSLSTVSTVPTVPTLISYSQFSTHQTKVTLSTKPQFSGSCVIKSCQLHWKECLIGTGCKRRRGKRILKRRSLHKSRRLRKRLSYKKETNPKPRPSIQDPSHRASWKFRKKKRVLTRSSPLKESATWKLWCSVLCLGLFQPHTERRDTMYITSC